MREPSYRDQEAVGRSAGVGPVGKRGGVRVIYYVRSAPDEIWLLVIYAKSATENIPAHLLQRIREAIEHE